MSTYIPICPPQEILYHLKEHYMYDPDTGILYRYLKTYLEYWSVGTYNADGYLSVQVKRRMFRIAHIAWFMHYGRWPVLEIDHIDRVRDNNRINNLREVTHDENMENSDLYTKIAKGVHKRKSGRYRARPWIKGKGNVHIGTFDTAEEAITAIRVYQ